MSYDVIAQTSNAENHDDHGRYSLRAGIFAENGTIRNQLLLADAGYVDFKYFSQLSEHGGSFIVRGGKNLNPVTIEGLAMVRGDYCPNSRVYETKEIDRNQPFRVLTSKN